jgi:hypothetical protein
MESNMNKKRKNSNWDRERIDKLAIKTFRVRKNRWIRNGKRGNII